jgi:nitrogen fixation-related uncharacterized protein
MVSPLTACPEEDYRPVSRFLWAFCGRMAIQYDDKWREAHESLRLDGYVEKKANRH